MNFKCLFGHKWDGCKCSKCGKNRDGAHDWSSNCEVCAECGKTRNDAHDWNGCKCSNCGKTRDEGHDWSKDCEKCAKCGIARQDAHTWNGCKCSKCGKTRDEGHEWNDCKCLNCGKVRDSYHETHDWSSNCNECSKCGLVRRNRHVVEHCKCKICGVEKHDIVNCECRSCGKSFHVWRNEECVKCKLSGSDRNKTVKCTKCGGNATLFLSSDGKEIYSLYEHEARQKAEYCEKCQKIFCASCGGFGGSGAGLAIYRSKCPFCGGSTKAPTEDDIITYIKGLESEKIQAGNISYLLMVVTHPIQPSAGQMSAFLFDRIPELSTSNAKIGFLWETKPIDTINIQALAIDTFGAEVADETKHMYRTLQFLIEGGEGKIFAVYDIRPAG